jgi:hypothetical protein
LFDEQHNPFSFPQLRAFLRLSWGQQLQKRQRSGSH